MQGVKTLGGQALCHRLALLLAFLASIQARNLSERSLQTLTSEYAEVPPQNIAAAEPLEVYRRWQGIENKSQKVFAVREDVIIRLSGKNFVPFTTQHQKLLVQAFREVVLPLQGPVQLTSYREGYPDPAAPESVQEPHPFVDLAGTVYHVLNASQLASLDSNATWQDALKQEAEIFMAWVLRVMILGKWTTPEQEIKLLQIDVNGGWMNETLVLHPIIVMEAVFAVEIADNSDADFLSADQSSAVASLVNQVLPGLGTLVEVQERDSASILSRLGPALQNSYNGGREQLLLLEVTMFTCSDNATLPTPDCELSNLQQLIAWALQAENSEHALQGQGVLGLRQVLVRKRDAPMPPKPLGPSPQPWIPWHLDRINQRRLPLDGKFDATASGTGVNVYLLSTGIFADHEEFQRLDGQPGSRVKPAWGYQGLDPLSDCPDAATWYSFGTYAASLIGGLKMGAAKNVTLYSVRYKEYCTFESPAIWSAGRLPSAMDTVLSTFKPPAIMVIDTWWSRDRLYTDNDAFIEKAITDRLDLAQAANITVVTAAGLGLPSTSPCDNVIARHPGVISVASSSKFDQRSVHGPWNSSCIDIWAPGGGLAAGVPGAHATTPSAYKTIISRSFGASWIAAGVAAQYLSLHPKSQPHQVRRALMDWATPDTVTGAGPNTFAGMLFTNFTESPAQVVGPIAEAEEGGGGMSAGVLAVVIVVPTLAAGCAVLLFSAWRAAKRRRQSHGMPQDAHPSMPISEWEVPCDELEICKCEDGSPFLLGEGSYGKVYKALKGGVQEVAVKCMHRMDEPLQDQFIQEIALMKYVSRDANIVQFYGACIKADNMMLVVEFMKGGDLRAALTNDSKGELSWYQRGKGIAMDIVRGLHFLHANHVIHRDIKSKNILLGRDGSAKIADVGLGRILEGPGLQCQQDGFMGTFAWAGPELLLGDRCTNKADIYSMGVVLWELATQEVPLRGCLRDVAVPRECPQEVADAIHSCMQRDPELRPTARELFDVLRSCPPTTQEYMAAQSLATTASQSLTTVSLDSRNRSHLSSCGSADTDPSVQSVRWSLGTTIMESPAVESPKHHGLALVAHSTSLPISNPLVAPAAPQPLQNPLGQAVNLLAPSVAAPQPLPNPFGQAGSPGQPAAASPQQLPNPFGQAGSPGQPAAASPQQLPNPFGQAASPAQPAAASPQQLPNPFGQAASPAQPAAAAPQQLPNPFGQAASPAATVSSAFCANDAALLVLEQQPDQVPRSGLSALNLSDTLPKPPPDAFLPTIDCEKGGAGIPPHLQGPQGLGSSFSSKLKSLGRAVNPALQHMVVQVKQRLHQQQRQSSVGQPNECTLNNCKKRASTTKTLLDIFRLQ